MKKHSLGVTFDDSAGAPKARALPAASFDGAAQLYWSSDFLHPLSTQRTQVIRRCFGAIAFPLDEIDVAGEVDHLQRFIFAQDRELPFAAVDHELVGDADLVQILFENGELLPTLRELVARQVPVCSLRRSRVRLHAPPHA